MWSMIYHEHLDRRIPDYGLVMKAVREALESNYVSEPPIAPIEIAGSYGIQVQFADFGAEHTDVSGFYDLQNRVIYVSEKDPPRRQTFTIAHELGHAILHGKLFETHPEDYQVLLRAPIGATKDPLEQEANAFAGHLLVPGKLLAKYQRIADNSELARLFNVSEDVIRFRKAFESRFAAA